MSSSTARLGIRQPDLSDAADAHADWTSAMGTIDGKTLIWAGLGLASARPAAGTVAGKLYYATDTGAVSLSDGTTWQTVNAFPLADQAAGTPSLRSLGTSAVQAAAGNDSRLSDTRTPSSNSVSTATLQAGAVTWSKVGSAVVANLVQVGRAGAINGETNAFAGRQLARTDFTTLMNANEPILLWNCSSFTIEQSVSTRAISSFGLSADYGVDGANGTNSCIWNSVGTGTAQAPNAVKTGFGSWGAWVKPQQPGTRTTLFGMWSTSGTDNSIRMDITADGFARFEVSTTGTATQGVYSQGNTYIGDDQWHFVVGTWDGVKCCVYVDGVLDSNETMQLTVGGTIFQGIANTSASLTFGFLCNSVGTQNTTGRLDEAFITSDILEESQVRFLYCRKIPHALATIPRIQLMNRQVYTRSAVYASTDFTTTWNVTQPTVGTNMRATTFVEDYGSSSLIPTLTGIVSSANGLDGAVNHAWGFTGSSNVIGSDATNFVVGLLPFSVGFWIKCIRPNAAMTVYAQGTAAGAAGRQIDVLTDGSIAFYGSGASATSQVIAPGVADGQWHFVVCVENLYKKIFVDGSLVGFTGINGNSIASGGASGFRLGQSLTATQGFTGVLGGFFYAKTEYQQALIQKMYQKQGLLRHDRQPLDPTNHIEKIDASNIYCVFDQLDETDSVEMILV